MHLYCGIQIYRYSVFTPVAVYSEDTPNYLDPEANAGSKNRKMPRFI